MGSEFQAVPIAAGYPAPRADAGQAPAPISDADPQTPPHVPSDPTLPPTSRPLGFSSTQASVLLDVIRGLAAVVVMAGHWRNLFFCDYSQIAWHPRLFAIPYVLTSGGHQAVMIFFVLSGYLISGSVFRLFAAGRWSWRTYLMHRLVRLWVVLLPGLVLIALCDYIGLHLLRPSAVALYTGHSGNHLVTDVRNTFNLRTWLGNLFFLQGVRFDIFGSDGPLWSLATEFWYYLMFPTGLLALRRDTRLPERLVCIALFLAMALTLGRTTVLTFPVWLLGTLLALLPAPNLTPNVARWWRIGASFVYFPAMFLIPKIRTDFPVRTDLLFGLLTFGFIWVLIGARGPAREGAIRTRLIRTLARFSFTLYVVHLPLLVLIAGLVLGPLRWQPDLLHIAIASVFLVITLLYGFGLAWLTEFRTDRVRAVVDRLVPGRVSSV
jgi:peptidoglycan/LPS O-acetylase OafA/YrhL